jgi:hypothetical protein
MLYPVPRRIKVPCLDLFNNPFPTLLVIQHQTVRLHDYVEKMYKEAAVAHLRHYLSICFNQLSGIFPDC